MILESGQYAIILRKIIHLSVRSLSHRKFLCLTRKISQNSKLEDYVNSPEVHRNARHILGSSIWYYTIISNLASVASKVLLHHRNNIPKPKLSTWKLVSPVVRNSILFKNENYASKLFKLISGRSSEMYARWLPEITYLYISVNCLWLPRKKLVRENLGIYVTQFTNRKWISWPRAVSWNLNFCPFVTVINSCSVSAKHC